MEMFDNDREEVFKEEAFKEYPRMNWNYLGKVLDIIKAFNTEKNYYDLLNTILTKMMEISDADAGTLYILEDEKLHFRIVRNITLGVYQSAYEKIDLPPIALFPDSIKNICAYCAVHNKIITIDDVYESEEFNFSGPRNYDKITGYRTRSMLTLPLTTDEGGKDRVIGVIQLLNAIDQKTGEPKPFDDIYNPPIIPSLANISANALANLLYAKEIKELFNSFVNVMTKAIDERSPYNENHTRNVATYARRLADHFNEKFPQGHKYYFTENRREQLIMACLLHDIGKIITPLEIMDKPDKLGNEFLGLGYRFELKRHQIEIDFLEGRETQEERDANINDLDEKWKLIESVNSAGFVTDETLGKVAELAGMTYIDKNGEKAPLLTSYDMEALSIRKGTLTNAERDIIQEHASVTSRLLARMKFNKYYEDVPHWAEAHHEYIDGTGYPRGISGSDVTIEICMLTILDVYDALTANDRPYKKAVPPEKAFTILQAMASEGKLHGELVELFKESKVWAMADDRVKPQPA